ncbi:glycosyltransferase family 4 protein [Aromatoleum toluolicum]|uniref:Glycosyltransferase n=1 Tax=Aromatoleum toluolicum TaxID=90060 RepID=A0ABX1NKM3_9RHOO|nr:glycosyltransferase family 4 protein [Aromatoleum toluolicum]NMF99892.1 glycosyltransferase family 4 protein [Aromatoleum toluolicum]
MPTRSPSAPQVTCSAHSESTRKAAILVLTSTFPRWMGDTEPPFVLELCRRLAVSYEVWVLAPHAPGAAVREQLDGLNVVRYRYFPARLENIAYEGGITAKLRKTPANYLVLPFFILSQWLAVRRLLRHKAFAAIHAHWLIPQGLIAITCAATRTRPPILCTSHGGDLFGLKGFAAEWIKRLVLRRAQRHTVVSQAMKRAEIELGAAPERIDVIPMGVDLRETFIPGQAARSGTSLLFVGRLVEKKGLAYLLEALPPLLTDFPDLTLTIAGDGPDRSALEQLATSHGLATHVRFLGRICNDQLPALYQRSEIVVFPSIMARGGDQEGFGLVAVEALGCECALIATDLPAMRDFLEDRVNALIVPQKDAHGLTIALRTLLDNPALRLHLQKAGRLSVLDRFDWPVIADRYARIIHNLIESPAGTTPREQATTGQQ